MSSQRVLMPFRPVTIVEALRARTFKCEMCGDQLSASQAWVPDLLNLYLGARKTEVNSTYPLTAMEIAGQARCIKHPCEYGVRMYPVTDTGAEMDSWVARNARQLESTGSTPRERFMQRQQAAAESRKRGPALIVLPDRPVEAKQPKKYRDRVHVAPSKDATEPHDKRFGDERKPAAPQANSKKNAKKQKEQEKADRKRRGRQ